MEKLTEFDPFTGIVTEMHTDYDGSLYVERTQDVEPIITNNKRVKNDERPGKDMRLVATIPNIVIEKWLREEGINVYKKEHWSAVRRKLNDPDWAHLRTWQGKI